MKMPWTASAAGALTYLGRYDEARRVAGSVHGFWGPWITAINELHASNFSAAESIGLAMLADPRQNVENPGGPELMLAYARRSRGALASADSCYARFWQEALRPGYHWGDLPFVNRQQLEFSALCIGDRPPPAVAGAADTTATRLINRGLQAAYLGRLEIASGCLESARSRPRREAVWEGVGSALLEATIWSAQGRWDDAARLLQPIAVQRSAIGAGEDELSWIRWTLADAYERLGRPDSAAVQLERITRDPKVRTFRPYASLRLVPLYVRLGRSRDALRHWTLAMGALDRPDPVLIPRIEQARRALAGTL
jgi:hypothetical protein